MCAEQLSLTELEAAIIDHVVAQEPGLARLCGELRVAKRQFTGGGSYTDFHCTESAEGDERYVVLDELITMPGVANGMGAALFCVGQHAKFLETFTFGGEYWDGEFDGFQIAASV